MKRRIERRITNLNKTLGGKLVRPGSLQFGIDQYSQNKNVFKKNAYLIRSIGIDHPFSDFNKTTTINITIENFQKAGLKCNEQAYIKGVIGMIKRGETNIPRIEKNLRKWCKKT